MIRLICIDVDGTLVGSSGVVPPEVWRMADRVRASGVHLAICSGRPGFGLTRGFAERLDPDGWHVFQNGASVVHLPTGGSRSRGIAPAAVARLMERQRTTHRVLQLYTDTEYAVESAGPRERQHARMLGVPFRPRGLLTLSGRIVRAQWLVSHEEARVALAESDPDLHLSRSGSPVMPDTTFINMTQVGVDKAAAVRAIADEYGTPIEQVMMVGDGANDCGVLAMVGYPVAMGNAEPEALALARHQVASVDDLGLVEALDLAMRVNASGLPLARPGIPG